MNRTLISALVATAIAAPFAALAVDASVESPAEIAAQGQSFSPVDVDTTVLYSSVDSAAERGTLLASDRMAFSSKSVVLNDQLRRLSVTSPAELAAK